MQESTAYPHTPDTKVEVTVSTGGREVWAAKCACGVFTASSRSPEQLLLAVRRHFEEQNVRTDDELVEQKG